MSFFTRLKYALIRFMQGRYGGNDQLNRFLLYGALAVMVLNIFFGSLILQLIYTAMWVWALFRMLSKNHGARYQENVKFTVLWGKTTTETKQFFVRLKNMKSYKYFRCPKCKARLRMQRGVGERTVVCGKCGEHIKQKA